MNKLAYLTKPMYLSSSVMILSSTNAAYASRAFAVDHVYPLVKNLSISMTQTRRKTLDLSAKAMLVNQSRSGNELALILLKIAAILIQPHPLRILHHHHPP